ncbi:MAG: ABC transporter permease [Phycisphaerae bacterium]
MGLHLVVLLGAVAVPGYAVMEAFRAVLPVPDAGQVATLTTVSRWLPLLGNTVAVCGLALLTALAFGLVAGIILARTDLPGRALFAALAVLGACVPVYVSAIFIFSHLPTSKLADSALACGLLYGLIHSPLAIVVLGATLRCADRELEDLARLDAGPAAVLIRVTIPQAAWGIAMLGILVVLLVGTDFTIPDLLFVRTFAEEVYTQFALHRSAAGPVLTSVPMLSVLAALLLAVQARYRLFGEHTPWQFADPPRTLALGRWRLGGAVVGVALVLALVGPPVVSLLGRIFERFASFGAFLAAARALQHDLLVSTLSAMAGATVIVLSAVGLAWALLRGGRLRVPLGVAVVLLLALPAPVVGISLIGLLDRPGPLGVLYDSPAVIAVGYVVRFLPIGIFLLVAAVQRVPREIESAARVDGCDWLAVQRYVYWPIVAADAAIIWLIIVILCFAEVGATTLLAPPGWCSASVRAFTLMHYGVYGDLALLAVLSVGIIFIVWLLLVYLLKRRFARPGLAAQDGA